MNAPLDIPPFHPHPLVRGGHAQTVLGAYLPQRYALAGTVDHRITMPDGDVLVLHDDCPAAWSPGERVVLLLHGLGGGHQSPYCLRMAAKLCERGVRAFRLDQRGCGAGVNLARYPGHAGRSEDAAAAIKLIARLCPASPLALVGYSLGGNIALKLAGECAGDPPGHLDRVAAICPPIDLYACSQSIGRGLNWLYDRAFIGTLTAMVEARRRATPELYEQLKLTPRPRKLFDFDHRITAPLSGFAGVEDYYARCSSKPLLGNVALPTLIISAADDPLIPPEIFADAKHSPSVKIHIAAGGGHLGFIARANGDPDRRWLDWRLLEWVEATPR